MKKINWKHFFKKGRNDDYVYDGFKKTVLIMAILFVTAAIAAGITNLYYSKLKIEDSLIGNRKIKTAFLFHLNQALTPYADVGDRSSYNNLLKTLRKHRDLKFNIHISGTLVQALLWYNPETIELIKEGVKDGQFEIIGSTYSQNVMYSTDMKSNDWQIKRHREILKEVFGVEPVGFWNPERTWSNNLGELMVKNGYKYTFIEDKTVRKSGMKGSEYYLRTTNNGKLIIVNDDNEILNKVKSAVDAGDYETKIGDRGALLTDKRKEYKQFFQYMRKIYKNDKDGQYIVSAADDAEINGLWDFEAGNNPDWDFKNLDYLLSEIEKKSWIETVKYSDAISKLKIKEDISPVKDGAAIWMDKAAKGKGDYAEQGYSGWFDFNSNSPKLAYYRKMHESKSRFFEKYGSEKAENIKNIIKLAMDNYLSHQFEFGCTGVSGLDSEFKLGKKYGMWENMRFMEVYSDVVENIKNPKDRVYKKDVDDDGIEEVVAVNGANYYVFSEKRGGRLLYWFDLKRGIEIVGGEIGLQLDENYYDGNIQIKPFSFSDFIRFLNGNDQFIEYFSRNSYFVRTGGLNERVLYKNQEGNIAEIFNASTVVTMENDKIEFSVGEFKKVIIFIKDGIRVDYKLPEAAEGIVVESEFQPDYFTILNRGIDALEIHKEKGKTVIYNKISKVGAEIKYSSEKAVKIDYPLFGIVSSVELGKGNQSIEIKKFNK